VVPALQRALVGAEAHPVSPLAPAERLGPARDLPARIEASVGRVRAVGAGDAERDGGWGASTPTTLHAAREPRSWTSARIDEPSADVTAHAVEMPAALGLGEARRAAAACAGWIESQEATGRVRPLGSTTYGTGAVVPALVAAGVSPSSGAVRRAVRWLERHQNEDGGWGEDPRSYDDPRWIGRGPSTASQTAWALLALHAAGESSPALWRGVDWLVATQRPDGTWDEPQYTGTGFPSDYYINYHLYRLTFPLMALGRCVRSGAASPGAAEGPALRREG
jgi:squalene-hopene/tetraprenyl-beta-curcumene cyclase